MGEKGIWGKSRQWKGDVYLNNEARNSPTWKAKNWRRLREGVCVKRIRKDEIVLVNGVG